MGGYRAEIQGGSRDGEIVPYIGPTMIEPVPRPAVFIAQPVDPRELPQGAMFRTRTYQAMRGADGELFYVLDR